jgi:hypothetical protein
MTGDELVRFCEGCRKNVYNLSAMTRREASKFVAVNSGKVCVRYVRFSDGKVQTAEKKLYKITRRASQVAAGVFGATLMLSAAANAQNVPPQKETESTKTTKTRNKNNAPTSQISFTVLDPNNGAIPTAEVKLTNIETAEEFTVQTDDYGKAYLNSIPPGKYTVEIAKANFTPLKRTIQIKERIEPNINVTLEVGAVVIGVIVDNWSEIPLFQAIAQENNEAVKNAINSGFKVNTKDSRNNTALHVAIEHGNLEIIKFLLEKGADVNARNSAKLTPIWMMMEEDVDDETSLQIFQLLVEKGANVNTLNDNKETLLMLACGDDNLEVVKILLKAGANPNLKDEDGETALMKTDSEEIKQLLIQYGAK